MCQCIAELHCEYSIIILQKYVVQNNVVYWQQEVERVLKVQLPALLPHLQSALTEPKTAVQRQDAFRVHAALQVCFQFLSV